MSKPEIRGLDGLANDNDRAVVPKTAQRKPVTPRKGRLAPGRKVLTLGALLAIEFPEREDLVGPWLRQGESAMVWAPPGVGKTWLTLAIALAVAGGGSFLGWNAPKPRKVLLVDGEMAAEDLKERLRQLAPSIEGLDMEAAGRNLTIYARTLQDREKGFPDLGERAVPAEQAEDRPAGQDEFMAKAEECGAELVLLDNFSTLAEVTDENDAAAMTPTMGFLLRLKQARIGCVLVHHSGKSGEGYRGSSKLATTFEVILGLRPIEEADREDGAAFRLDWTKFRRKPGEAVRAREVRLVGSGEGLEWTARASVDDEVRKLVVALRTGMFATQKEIADHLGWVPSKVTTLKGRAFEQGAITKGSWDTYLEAARETQTEAAVEAWNPDF